MKNKMFGALLLVLAIASNSFAQEIKLPKEIKGDVGDFIRVSAETTGKVKWISIDSGLKIFPVELLKETKVAVVVSMKPGKYRLIAYTAKNNEPSDPVETTVIVGSGVDPNPPVPNPPTPPTPPVPPNPQDPLTKSIKEAYLLERGDTKDKFRLGLIESFKLGSLLSQDQTVNQAFAVFTRMSAKRLESVPDSEFRQVRFAIKQYLDKKLPTDVTAQLGESDRKLLKQEFDRIVQVLENLE